MLPRIKFRNPTVPIEILRHNDPAGPSLLHVYTNSNLQSTPATTAQQPPSTQPNSPTPDAPSPTYTLDIRDQQESEILEALVKAVGARELEPTQEDKLDMQEVAEQKERSDKDRVLRRDSLLKERRDAEMMKLARGEGTEAI